MVKRDEKKRYVGGSHRPEVKTAKQVLCVAVPAQNSQQRTEEAKCNRLAVEKNANMMKISKNVAILCGLPIVFHDDDWR